MDLMEGIVVFEVDGVVVVVDESVVAGKVVVVIGVAEFGSPIANVLAELMETIFVFVDVVVVDVAVYEILVVIGEVKLL